MSGTDPIRIDRFRSEASRVQSTILMRQYRVSVTLAALLVAASCLVVLAARPEAPVPQAAHGLAFLVQR